MSNNETAAAPTALAPYLATEETRLRYSNSLTIVDLTGTVANLEGYNLCVSKHGETSFWVTWTVKTLEPARLYNTSRAVRWGKGWSAKFRTEKAALAFAATKLETLRGWADKRETAAA